MSCRWDEGCMRVRKECSVGQREGCGGGGLLSLLSIHQTAKWQSDFPTRARALSLVASLWAQARSKKAWNCLCVIKSSRQKGKREKRKRWGCWGNCAVTRQSELKTKITIYGPQTKFRATCSLCLSLLSSPLLFFVSSFPLSLLITAEDSKM